MHQQSNNNHSQQPTINQTSGGSGHQQNKKKNRFESSGGPRFTNVVVTTSPAFYSLNHPSNTTSSSSNQQQQGVGSSNGGNSLMMTGGNSSVLSSSGSNNNNSSNTMNNNQPKSKPYKSLVSKPVVQIKGTPQILAKKPSTAESSSNLSNNNTISNTPVGNTPNQPTILQKNPSEPSSRRINQHLQPEISQNFTSGSSPTTLNTGSLPLTTVKSSLDENINKQDSPQTTNGSSNVEKKKASIEMVPLSFDKKCLNLIQENSSGMYNTILELQSNQNLQAMSNLFPNDKQVSTESNNYSVIGVIGKQGSGKSKILNSLIGSGAEIFPQEDLECFLDCKYKTSGIDIYRTSEQQIFIDTQPLFSSQIQHSFNGMSMNSLMKPFETSVEAVSIAALESFIDITSLQIALFVFSVCHVVLVVVDHQADSLEQFKMYQFIQTIRMLQQGVPTISQCGKSSSQQKPTLEGHVPEVIFVYNKVSPTDMSELNIKHTESLLESYFTSTSFRKNGFIHPHMWHHQFKKNDIVNFFMIPMESSKIKDEYKDSINLLRKGIQNMPKPNLKKMSQNEWFGNSVRNFEVIKKSYFLQEYIRKITSSMSIHN
ncbi:predicted protein [Naegleria gruberi]|uniref:Predicted protein n=1 Tax=Naegleria gruberi TaxID=5762 RepID=D2VSD9_NAEGR|nr:uncharacterized protein NAEGRDRAFT_71906 [Naegleria gruberi]EFC40330.1 predicted protein [Naegleria gruberi]|eukprot:XP_002673074.1 predicted protein [Naegleria gruberi strain NEG-M]